MRLTTERLEIGPLTAAEAQAFADYRRQSDVARFQSWSTDFSSLTLCNPTSTSWA